MRVGRSIHQLGSPALSWDEVSAFIEHAPPDSAVHRLENPMGAYDTADAQLMTLIVDALHGANWQRGGGKGPKPRPLRHHLEDQARRIRLAASAPTSVADLDAVRRSLAAKRRRLSS